MLEFKPNWNLEINSYARKYGAYQGHLDCFDEKHIQAALWNAKQHFQDTWAKEFFDVAMDPHNQKKVVTIEQGAHQVENVPTGGFVLHFTGRDTYGYAFHFYIQQENTGNPYISKITYMDNGKLVSLLRQ